MEISFHCSDYQYNIKDKRRIIAWLNHVALIHKKSINTISVIFTSSKEIVSINKKYLQHNYETDIITFDYSDKISISGDLFICIPMVKSNAKYYNKLFTDELLRVIVHGVLHLLGYKDKTENESKTMREKEEEFIAVYKNEFTV